MEVLQKSIKLEKALKLHCGECDSYLKISLSDLRRHPQNNTLVFICGACFKLNPAPEIWLGLEQKFPKITTETDVHTEHCCLYHGCKYRDLDCSVEKMLKIQSYSCEDCS